LPHRPIPLTIPTALLKASKIKVNQAGSRWIKVNQPIFKHFFSAQWEKFSRSPL
jgi:hypothetical protein